MICPTCKYEHSKVFKSEPDQLRGITIRRRECLKCGSRFTTHEELGKRRQYDTDAR